MLMKVESGGAVMLQTLPARRLEIHRPGADVDKSSVTRALAFNASPSPEMRFKRLWAKKMPQGVRRLLLLLYVNIYDRRTYPLGYSVLRKRQELFTMYRVSYQYMITSGTTTAPRVALGIRCPYCCNGRARLSSTRARRVLRYTILSENVSPEHRGVNEKSTQPLHFRP